MNKSNLIGPCLLIAASALLLPFTSVFANPPLSPPSGMSRHLSTFDWVKHTQQTLDDLKGKLDLKPGQLPAWDIWATGVITDTNQQVERDKAASDETAGVKEAMKDETTPERMAKGIARLRAQTDWMQAQLVRLDAAQVRTKTFYEALETEQKTIFDLFWTVMHHRGDGQTGWQTHMPMHMPMHMSGPKADDEQDQARNL